MVEKHRNTFDDTPFSYSPGFHSEVGLDSHDLMMRRGEGLLLIKMSPSYWKKRRP